jgi:hypothetical protein
VGTVRVGYLMLVKTDAYDYYCVRNIIISNQRMRRILYGDLEMPLIDIYAKTTSGFKSLPGSKLSYIVMDNYA